MAEEKIKKESDYTKLKVPEPVLIELDENNCVALVPIGTLRKSTGKSYKQIEVQTGYKDALGFHIGRRFGTAPTVAVLPANITEIQAETIKQNLLALSEEMKKN